MFAFLSCPRVGSPTIGTKSFDSASNSIFSDGPTGYMTNRSSCYSYNFNEKIADGFLQKSMSQRHRFVTSIETETFTQLTLNSLWMLHCLILLITISIRSVSLLCLERNHRKLVEKLINIKLFFLHLFAPC